MDVKYCHLVSITDVFANLANTNAYIHMHTYTYPISISTDQSIDKYRRVPTTLFRYWAGHLSILLISVYVLYCIAIIPPLWMR